MKCHAKLHSSGCIFRSILIFTLKSSSEKSPAPHGTLFISPFICWMKSICRWPFRLALCYFIKIYTLETLKAIVPFFDNQILWKQLCAVHKQSANFFFLSWSDKKVYTYYRPRHSPRFLRRSPWTAFQIALQNVGAPDLCFVCIASRCIRRTNYRDCFNCLNQWEGGRPVTCFHLHALWMVKCVNSFFPLRRRDYWRMVAIDLLIG